jgi:hypothetical protein
VCQREIPGVGAQSVVGLAAQSRRKWVNKKRMAYGKSIYERIFSKAVVRKDVVRSRDTCVEGDGAVGII